MIANVMMIANVATIANVTNRTMNAITAKILRAAMGVNVPRVRPRVFTNIIAGKASARVWKNPTVPTMNCVLKTTQHF